MLGGTKPKLRAEKRRNNAESGGTLAEQRKALPYFINVIVIVNVEKVISPLDLRYFAVFGAKMCLC